METPAPRHLPVTPTRSEAATLHTTTGIHALDVRLADGFVSRFCGLMLARALPDGHALLLTHCTSVHSAFMLYPIDVIYLDRHGVVTKCVSALTPWRCSAARAGRDRNGQPYAKASHTLELAAGMIARLGIAPGDRLLHPYWRIKKAAPAAPRERGSAMIEFTIVGPLITLLGLGMIQYGMLFFAKNQINHASFMAARAGATEHADLASIATAYTAAMAPLYANGKDTAAIADALARAKLDMAGKLRIELLNPTKESFADWNEPALQLALQTGGKRVIPNSGQAFKSQEVRTGSGQTVQDANLIKLRITQGYKPKVPLINHLYTTYLKWLDPKTDAFHSEMVNAGRIPVVSNVTLQMQSDAIEPDNPVSTPGPGNGGAPVNPGDPPVVTTPPPECKTVLCETQDDPAPPACNPASDPNQCRPIGCKQGEACDPGCGTMYCCTQAANSP